MPPAIRLIQADDVDAWQRALLALCLPAIGGTTRDGQALEAPVVLVPSQAAAEHWRQTLEQRVIVEGWTPPRALQQALEHDVAPGPHAALVLPRLLTRDGFLDACHRAARLDRPRLQAMTREVLMGASARQAARAHPPPFLIRPGLVSEMVRFCDTVVRLGHDVGAWLAAAADRLADEAPTDRGAERLLAQTRFMQAAWTAYDDRLRRLEALDERGLREMLQHSRHAWSPRHVIVSVADHHAQPEGLWPVDLPMLARAPGLARLDVVLTRRVAEGVRRRLLREWPEATDVRIPVQRPTDTRLEVDSTERRWIVCRDRHEEIVACTRRLKAWRPDDPSRTAVVSRRPLPYLYVAQQLFDAAGIPLQTTATLPLAAEPRAASVDLLMDAALSGFTRASLVSLLRSAQVRVLCPDGADVRPADVAAFDAWLANRRYLGTIDALDRLLATPPPPRPRDPGGPGDRGAQRALGAWQDEMRARVVGEALRPVLALLAPLQAVQPGATHVRALRDAWFACERLPHDDEPFASRTRRTRAAIAFVLEQLESALDAHDATPVPPRDTCALVKRWLEERTLAVAAADEGAHLVEADAAPYGLFDHVRIVGLLEGEWPEPTARDIFYPAFMLEAIGWAEERTRAAALRGRFADLLTLAGQTVGVSVPELDQDAVVRPSALLDELRAFGPDRLVALNADEAAVPVTGEDALLSTPAFPAAPVLSAQARTWASWRLARPAPESPGQTGPVGADRYSVTAVETYLQCPFQYFAGRVLGLREEIDEEPGLPAREAGLFLHGVLHDCHAEWARRGAAVIRAEDLPRARAVFTEVAERALLALPPADRAIERVRLFGSAVATGAIEKVLRVEVEAFGDVTRRALEHDIDLAVELPAAEGTTRTVRIRGRVDRVDFTADDRVRVVDYKMGRRPTQPLQPGVYAHAVVQQARAEGRQLGIAPSGFVAFREESPWVASAGTPEAAADQARTFVEAVEQIESGAFPVRPANEFRCQFCDYASVCRKDYVGDA